VNPNGLSFWRQFLLLAAAGTFFLISKNYLFSLLFICLVSSALFLTISGKKLELRTLKLLSAFLVPLVIFPSIATSIATVAKGALEVKQIAITPTGTPTVPARGQTLHDLNQQFDKNSILSWLSKVTDIQSILDERGEASYPPAGSIELSESTTQLQTQPASLADPLTLLVGAYNFLFVPTPFVDNGSFFLNAQSYESFAWCFYYLIQIILLVGLIRRRYVLTLVSLCSTLFSLGFIAMSALIEINEGTSVRHRAVLLIAILVMLATFQHKQPERLED
jgi:hypothetical protein